MKRIILASASPRRRELLEKIGLNFEVEPRDSGEELDLRFPVTKNFFQKSRKGLDFLLNMLYSWFT